MPEHVSSSVTWMEPKGNVIILANTSRQNYILDLPSGRYRLDAGRRMRTLRSILNYAQVKALVDGGQLVVENS